MVRTGQLCGLASQGLDSVLCPSFPFVRKNEMVVGEFLFVSKYKSHISTKMLEYSSALLAGSVAGEAVCCFYISCYNPAICYLLPK